MYGVTMKCIRPWAISEPHVDCIHPSHVISYPQLILDLDLYKVKVEDLEFKAKFNLEVTKDYDVFGFISWFDVFFSHGKKTKVISTSPHKD